MPKAQQFVGYWVSWKGDNRFEQVLNEDETFKGFIFDDDDTLCHAAIGTWKIDGDTICWRYTKGGPKGVDKNKVVHLDAGRFSVKERDGERTDWYRGIKGSRETSTNFGPKEVRPFLKRLSALVDSGFGPARVNGIARELKKLKRERTRQYVFPITFEGTTALLGIRVFMDDIDAPDIYFYAPLKLLRQIEKRIEQLDPEAGG
jgi:hypothetical protein